MIIDPATSHSTNRGEFSYFAGDREACTMCPLGTECTGGDGVQTSWGWWMSEGLHSEKSKQNGHCKQEIWKFPSTKQTKILNVDQPVYSFESSKWSKLN